MSQTLLTHLIVSDVERTSLTEKGEIRARQVRAYFQKTSSEL